MPSLFEQILAIFWPQRSPQPQKVLEPPKQESRGTEPNPDAEPLPPPPAGPRDPVPLEKCRKWRLTEYYLASQEDHGGQQDVPILDKNGNVIDRASAAFFSSLALEGSGITGGGKLVNVAGTWVKCRPSDYRSVWTYHQAHLSKRPPTYSGLQVQGNDVVKVLAFYEVPHDKFGEGFGICNGIPMVPYRTLAADIGRGKKSDPKFVSGGGVVPLGTDVYIHELKGTELPDQSIHDGWCKVNDTGGGIFGAHFDVFIGHELYDKKVHVPHIGHIWFEGIDKLPDPYVYGLEDK